MCWQYMIVFIWSIYVTVNHGACGSYVSKCQVNAKAWRRKKKSLVQKKQENVSQILWNGSLHSKHFININIFGCTFYMGLTAMLQLMLLMTAQRSNERFIVWSLLDDDGLQLCTVKSVTPLKVQGVEISCSEIIYDLFVSGNVIWEERESET